LPFETVLGVWNFSPVLQNVCYDKLHVFFLCKIVYACHMFFYICICLCFSLKINKLQNHCGIHANFDIPVVIVLIIVDGKNVLMCIRGNNYWTCELLFVRHLFNSSYFRIDCHSVSQSTVLLPVHAILKTETRCNVWLI
jgi:hypothetical protein